MVTRKIFFGDGDGEKKIFFRWRWRWQKNFFSVTVTVTRKFFSVRVTVDSTRDTPSCLKNFEKTRGVFRPSLSNFVFRNLLGKGGGRCQKILKKSFKFLSFFPIFWPKLALKFKKISPAAHLGYEDDAKKIEKKTPWILIISSYFLTEYSPKIPKNFARGALMIIAGEENN